MGLSSNNPLKSFVIVAKTAILLNSFMTIQEALTPSFSTSILDALPDTIVWMYPIYNSNGTIEDFEVRYANQAAKEGSTHPSKELIGLRILRDNLPTREAAQENFNYYLEVLQTGKQNEYSFYNHSTGSYFDMVRRTLEGGILSTARDRKEQREAE